MTLNALATATSAVDINVVGDSWTQENASDYVWTRMPMAKCLDKSAGYTGVHTYEIPALGNALLKTNDLMDWDPGNDPGVDRVLEHATVTLTCRGRQTPNTLTRPIHRSGDHRLRDLESNLVPILLLELYQGLEKKVAATLFSTTCGTSETFSAVLDTYSSSMNALQEIEADLRDLRKYQFMAGAGLSLECVIDDRVLSVLQSHDSYTGAGEGSNASDMMPRDAFLSRFQAAHRLNAVHVIKTVRDSVDLGQTSSPTEIGSGGMGFYLFDRRGEADLTDQNSFDAPDGSFVLGMARKPEVVNWVDEAREVEYFAGRTSFGTVSPRGNTFGIFYPTGQCLS